MTSLSDYLDALAYIDAESYTPERQAQAQRLIEEEMKTFTPGDYFVERPLLDVQFEV